jgi:hypothetical protein
MRVAVYNARWGFNNDRQTLTRLCLHVLCVGGYGYSSFLQFSRHFVLILKTKLSFKTETSDKIVTRSPKDTQVFNVFVKNKKWRYSLRIVLLRTD